MIWRWLRRRVDMPTVDPSVQRAADESQQRLEQAREQTGAVMGVVHELQRIRRQNNFAAMIRSALGEHR